MAKLCLKHSTIQYDLTFCHLLPYLDMLGLATQSYNVQSNIFVPFETIWVSWLANILKFMEMAKEHESTVTVLEFIPSMENTAIQNT